RELTAEDRLRSALHSLVQPRRSRRSPRPARQRSQARRLGRRLQRLEEVQRLDERRPLRESAVPALISRVTHGAPPWGLIASTSGPFRLKRSLATLAIALAVTALSAAAASADTRFEDPAGDTLGAA